MTSTKHQLALDYAKHCIGVKEVPFGSNHGPIQRTNPDGGVDFFQEHDFLAGTGYPWCVSFAQTCWWVGAGDKLPYLTGSAFDLFNWAKKVGWAKNSNDCIPGDIIVYGAPLLPNGHVGILESQAGTSVVSIDGNWDSQVQRVTHPRYTILGGVHIPEVHKVPPPPKPYWVITADEKGKRVLVFSQFASEKTILGLLPRLLLKYGKGGITIKKGGVKK